MPTYAEDLNHRTLRTRLCSDGPKGCTKCRGCAFGIIIKIANDREALARDRAAKKAAGK